MEKGNPYWLDQIKSGLSFFVEGDGAPCRRRSKERCNLIGINARRRGEDEEKCLQGSRDRIGTRLIFAARERSLSFLQSPLSVRQVGYFERTPEHLHPTVVYTFFFLFAACR